jgi:hypothetical protein
MAEPIPVLAPVITATLSFNSMLLPWFNIMYGSHHKIHFTL